jgi:hypothetical protein
MMQDVVAMFCGCILAQVSGIPRDLALHTGCGSDDLAKLMTVP